MWALIFCPLVASAEEVDVEIVLAVDASGSIDAQEYELQMQGYADAFNDPGLQAAILSGPIGKVAIALVLWADAAFAKIPTKWFIIESREDAEAFARELVSFHEHTGRRLGIGGGGTGIGEGVRHAIMMIQNNGHNGLRRIIDVSGDGIETDPWFAKAIKLPTALKMAERASININGLAILKDFPTLDNWYRQNVIRGPGSFVIRAENFEDFGAAILQKLWREFSHNITMNGQLPNATVNDPALQ